MLEKQVGNVVRLLGPAADEGVAPSEELAAILLSKLALEPDSHVQIARSGAIPVGLQHFAVYYHVTAGAPHVADHNVLSSQAGAVSPEKLTPQWR